ncbi:MAG: hypothetical protein JSV56_09410 [Methanomassiliicoccales archaeon]|nr:MAG: hypothetical protein JSV56_09410 [Methanomassiliicoccales archaeon]
MEGKLIPSGQEEQFSQMFGLPLWSCCAIIIIMALPIFYSIFYVIGQISLRNINNKIKERFSKLEDITLNKNDFGIFDISGSYKGRKIDVKHLSSILARPKVFFMVEHKIPNISSNIRYNDLTITTKAVEKIIYKWPENRLNEIDRLIFRISEFESEPSLISLKRKIMDETQKK